MKNNLIIIFILIAGNLWGYPAFYMLNNGAAQLNNVRNNILSVSLKNKFIKSFNEINFLAITPIYTGVVDISLTLLTNGYAYQSSCMFGYIKRITPIFSTALNFETSIFSIEKKVSTYLYIRPSFHVTLSKQLAINSDIRIPVRFKPNKVTEAPILGSIYLGTTYSPVENLRLDVGIYHELNGEIHIESNILYKIQNVFAVLLGIDNKTFSGGFGWKNKKMNLWLKTCHYNIVGWETTLTAEIRI